MATVLLTKLAVPPPRPERVARPRLFEQLTAALDRKLTLVSAPAGFGKTTLLADWAAGCGRPVAWLSLDPGDNDPARFLGYLVAALQTVDATVGRDLPEAPPSQPAEALEVPLTVLLNELGPAGPLVLVLDDYHLISAEGIHAALTFLVEHLPAGIHLAIATRADPPLPLARWRGRGQLSEVRASDLQFTVEETRAFLNLTMGLPLDDADSAALHSRTEGWVAGLQLAGLSLRGRTDARNYIAGFAGSNRHVLDFLVEEVLARQSTEVQQFLLRTSVLTRLTGPLCDAVVEVSGPADGPSVLASLDAANLFTVPLDDERRWYRYHHLFADCLRSQLRHADPMLEPLLHHRAAEWHAANGLPAEAVEHALQAADPAYAAGLIEGAGFDLLAHSEFATVRRWLEILSTEIIECHPSLCVFYGWIFLESFVVDRAKRWLDRPSDADLPAHLRLLRAALLARLRWLHGEPGEARPLVSEAFLNLGPFESPDIPDPRVRTYLMLYASTQLAEALRLQGQLRGAIQTYREALRRAAPLDPDARLLSALSFAEMGLGRLLYEQDDLEAADRHFTRATELARRGRNEQYEAWVGMLAPPLRQAQGRGAEAIELVESAADSARRRGLDAEVVWCAAMRARLALLRGDRESVAAWARAYGTSAEPGTADGRPLGYVEEFAEATYARALLALGRAEEAARLIERLLARTEAVDQTAYTIELLALNALAFQARGDAAQAFAALERALALAEPEGYVRTFVDEGQPLARLLAEGSPRWAPVNQVYARRLLGASGQHLPDGQFAEPLDTPRPSSPARGPSQRLVEPLSAREREVLALLAEGLPNHDIAERLIVSVGTIKRHTGNIYGKLGVTSRTQAILKAQELALL